MIVPPYIIHLALSEHRQFGLHWQRGVCDLKEAAKNTQNFFYKMTADRKVNNSMDEIKAVRLSYDEKVLSPGPDLCKLSLTGAKWTIRKRQILERQN
ncbi:hypothetical protein EGR_07210 [Echinococcus granulosus]|uniref:Uncharacterized protein n=1 Tax=Echinococcus granulosus TaxID=6210 RepID=W6UA74_ECHGR|nr:hypothetical protein EGR_07210 [Echinococcus granulosus]EUB57940.1 hypothetical protein EGR_07210 [Echinococcus granulosus]